MNTQDIIRQLKQTIRDTEEQLKQADNHRRQFERESSEQIRRLQSNISEHKRNLGTLNSLEDKVQRGDPHAVYQWRRLMWRM